MPIRNRLAQEQTPKKKRGASRMREQGYVQTIVWWDQNEFAVVSEAARKCGMKLATYVRSAVVAHVTDSVVKGEKR